MTDVALREFLEQKICALDRRVDARFMELDKAIELQAEKDRKHLEALNHEQSRLLADRERFLPRETYAVDRKDKLATILAIFAIILEIVIAIIMWIGLKHG